ncbi:hypothetical protein ANRL1_02713 [Anaerolineae bacterium]|nr:hypothetical protein ANRL1_02713 [Anaerolineae bacterium]
MDIFPVIILIGRPAAGKSEVIDYLKKLPEDERCAKMHVAPFDEIDDFIWVWETFEEDDIRSKHGRPRQNTTPDYFFTDPFIWNLYIEKMNLAFAKRLARDANCLRDRTVIIEFARGGENGFGEAFAYLSDEILRRAVIVYINVSYAESVRRNHKRARKGLEDSILYHSLPDAKMERYYQTNDWDKLSGGKREGIIEIKNHRVPFAVFQNEPEKTDDPSKLGPALEEVFEQLWYASRHVNR